MTVLHVAVLGAGTAGLAAALASARDGHRVTLVERDEVSAGEPLASFEWKRAGIPHFFQAHAFIPRGRKEMREGFPDVYDTLVRAGAWDLDLRPKIPGPTKPEDEDLVYLAVRRPMIEWALRKAVLEEPRIDVRSGVRVTGFGGDEGEVPRVRSVATTNGTIAADVVVDALGRRSSADDWIEALGGRARSVRSSECDIIYYTRYYRVRAGVTLPDGPWIPTPRADLGYAAFSTFPGDNGTFAGIFAIAPQDRELKDLRHTAAFDEAARSMPALDSWTNPDVAEAITGVLAMGSLQNTIKGSPGERAPAVGVFSVADAVCHTDPVLALGLSFSLIHARAIARALREHSDLGDAERAFDADIRPAIEERFSFACALDEQRRRRWMGETVDLAHAQGGAYELFTFAAGTAAALVDADVFRSVIRRNGFLDPLSVLDRDTAMQKRIESVFAGLLARGPARSGPTRDELLAIVRRSIA